MSYYRYPYVTEIARAVGVTRMTIHRWLKKVPLEKTNWGYGYKMESKKDLLVWLRKVASREIILRYKRQIVGKGGDQIES